jgi:hypothetical protein
MPKKYEIEGGRWVTVPQLVEELGQDKDLMAMRLSRGITSIEKLKKPRNKYKQRFKPKTVKTKPKEAEKKYDYQYKVADVIKQRMYFDPLGHWKLLNNMGKKA